MHITTSVGVEISGDSMHQYVASPATLKAMMHMLSKELDRGAKEVYLDATEARICFPKYFTI